MDRVAKALTSCFKFQGTRKKDKLGAQLGDDLVNEVVNHLPAVSNFRFKCVSKQWFFLNSEALKLKSQTSTMSGIFYSTEDPEGYNIRAEYAKTQKDENEDSFIDGTLSFLPKRIKLRDMIIYDSCGGLLLCGNWDEYGLYVCNPATRKWVKIPSSQGGNAYAAILDCKPLVSVYFNIILIDVFCYLRVFSSETGEWKVISEARILPNSALLFKGLIFGINSKRISGFDMEGNLCRRFDLPGISHQKDYLFISSLGQSGGYLHYCYSSNGVVYVWKLVDYESCSWLLKNSFQIINPENKRIRIKFHPYEDDVVFVGIGNRWHSYNVKTTQMVEICSVIDKHSLFPYSPCYLDGLGNEVEGKWTRG